jgi:glycosyltransferase involved in cell wall biosynthesis
MINTALAHHWLVGMRGGEKVLEQIGQLFPQAPIYTLVANPEKLSPELRSHRIIESPLQYLPVATQHYKKLLPFFPAAFHGLRVEGNPGLLLTSDASVTKGLSYDPDVAHVCYCHSPPRYLWGMQDTYLKHTAGLGAMQKTVFKSITPYVRRFDYEAAQKVTHFIANSRFVQRRIRACYGREAKVINPPVDVAAFDWQQPTEDFYLVVSELVPYKRIDVAVDAFNRLGKRLVIIGAGTELEKLKARAKSNITFLGRQPFSVLKEHYETCRAFIFPGIEDFGITPLESQAAGRPVIALRAGGALETVTHGETGVFFDEQTPQSLAEAVLIFEKNADYFSGAVCRKNAERYAPEHFRAQLKRFLSKRLPDLFADYVWPDETPLVHPFRTPLPPLAA